MSTFRLSDGRTATEYLPQLPPQQPITPPIPVTQEEIPIRQRVDNQVIGYAYRHRRIEDRYATPYVSLPDGTTVFLANAHRIEIPIVEARLMQ